MLSLSHVVLYCSPAIERGSPLVGQDVAHKHDARLQVLGDGAAKPDMRGHGHYCEAADMVGV